MSHRLPPVMIGIIAAAVEKLFAKARARFEGKIAPNAPKKLSFSFIPSLSVSALFNAAAKMEGTQPNEELRESVNMIGTRYLDAIKEKATAKTVHKVQTFLTDAKNKGVDTDLETVLGGELSDLWGELSNEVKRVVETETTVARNMSIMDSISKVNLSSGIQDPLVFFIIVRDGEVCGECTRLHMQPDGVTPRVWKMSEVGSGYHKKGEENPKVGGLHPHCRCQLATLLPGYGFDGAGRVTYKESGWDEYAHQRGNL